MEYRVTHFGLGLGPFHFLDCVASYIPYILPIWYISSSDESITNMRAVLKHHSDPASVSIGDSDSAAWVELIHLVMVFMVPIC